MKNTKAGVLFITVTLDMIGIGLVIPSLPDIMRRFVSEETRVSEYFGYFIALYALMQFIAAPLLGPCRIVLDGDPYCWSLCWWRVWITF